MNKWLTGGGLIAAILVGTGLRKVSEVVKKEELNAPVVVEAKINKENITPGGILINRKGIAGWLTAVKIETLPKNNNVVVCSAYGCAHQTKFKFNASIYNDAKSVLGSAKNPEEERNNLKIVIDKIKLAVGEVTGTINDRPGEPFLGNGNPEQMSELDETVNTVQYLYLLADGGYIRFHHLETPEASDYFIGSTNIIVDKDTGSSYAVGYDKEGKASIVAK